MLTDPHPAVFVAGSLLILALGYLRLRAGPEWFALDSEQSRIWNPIRRHVLTPLHSLTEDISWLYTKTTVTEDEMVDTVDYSVDGVLARFAALEEKGFLYSKQPLASIAEDWTGRLEKASIAYYYGPKFGRGWLPDRIVDSLPEWTRKYQVHVRLFERERATLDTPVGEMRTRRTAITAHAEKAPWYPMNWISHLVGSGFDAKKGVRTVAAHLGLNEPEPTDTSEP